MIYLDSSAVVKLAHFETATEDLISWLANRHGDPLVSSVLVEVEVSRAIRRHAPESLDRVASVLERLYRIEIDDSVRKLAASYSVKNLRSLDAIHLATAQLLSEGSEGLTLLVAYDHRLLAEAIAINLNVASPGMN